MSNYLTKHMIDPLTCRNAADNEAVRREDGAFWRWLSAATQRWRQRKTIRALENLDDRMLADIGIYRNDIPHVAATLDERRGRMNAPRMTSKTAKTVKASGFGRQKAA